MRKIKKLFALIIEICQNILAEKNKVYYITEDADWVIKDIGLSLQKNIQNFVIAKTHIGLKNSVIHYSSLNTFFTNNGFKLPHNSNKIVITIFHIVDGDMRSQYIKKVDMYISFWHTSCSITKEKLIKFGATPNKIIVIPIGIDTDRFKPLKFTQLDKQKKELKIFSPSIVVGYFQKDGNGWSEGLEPKLIKGPDIFCDVIEKLSEKYDIFVLLTGPARGYVKNRLNNVNIPYIHEYLDDPNEVAKYFQICDLYMVTSREEGGPKAILESMACGVPLISTKVGMAPDVIVDGENGFLVEIENVEAIYDRACQIIEDEKLKEKLVQNGLITVKAYNWITLSEEYKNKIYKELIR